MELVIILLLVVFVGQIITVVTILKLFMVVNNALGEWLIEVQKDLRKRLPHASDW
jgi:hypothetical protein